MKNKHNKLNKTTKNKKKRLNIIPIEIERNDVSYINLSQLKDLHCYYENQMNIIKTKIDIVDLVGSKFDKIMKDSCSITYEKEDIERILEKYINYNNYVYSGLLNLQNQMLMYVIEKNINILSETMNDISLKLYIILLLKWGSKVYDHKTLGKFNEYVTYIFNEFIYGVNDFEISNFNIIYQQIIDYGN